MIIILDKVFLLSSFIAFSCLFILELDRFCLQRLLVITNEKKKKKNLLLLGRFIKIEI